MPAPDMPSANNININPVPGPTNANDNIDATTHKLPAIPIARSPIRIVIKLASGAITANVSGRAITTSEILLLS